MHVSIYTSYMHIRMCGYLSEAVPEGSWQVALASISGRVHGSQQPEIGVAGYPHHVTPLCNGHAAAATLQQPRYPLQSLNSNGIIQA